MKIFKVLLGAESFDRLISGEVITKEFFYDEDKSPVEVQIALQDIGFHYMLDTMLKAYKTFLAERKEPS